MRLLIAVVLLIAAPWPSHAQPLVATAPPATLSAAEMEKFLLDGRIVKKKESSKGVTSAGMTVGGSTKEEYEYSVLRSQYSVLST